MWLLLPPTASGVVATPYKNCVRRPPTQNTRGVSKNFKQSAHLAKTLSADSSDEGAGRRGRQAAAAPSQARIVVDLARRHCYLHLHRLEQLPVAPSRKKTEPKPFAGAGETKPQPTCGTKNHDT
jgi:hypothetical protein